MHRIAAESWPPFLIIYCPNGSEKPWAGGCPDGGKVTYGGVLWDFLLLLQRARIGIQWHAPVVHFTQLSEISYDLRQFLVVWTYLKIK